jgi:putative transposase
VFTDRHLRRLETVARDVCVELVERNGETNHVHLLVSYPLKSLCRGWSARSWVCRPA